MTPFSKSLLLSVVFTFSALPASAHNTSHETAPKSGETFQSESGDDYVYTQIGDRVYACQIVPSEPQTIIAEPIYLEQKHDFDLDRLSRSERKHANLPKRLFERYVGVLPINVGAQSVQIENAIVSSHSRGRGPCIGVGASSNYGGHRRTECGIGVSIKISIGGPGPNWCVLGQDVLSQLPKEALARPKP